MISKNYDIGFIRSIRKYQYEKNASNHTISLNNSNNT